MQRASVSLVLALALLAACAPSRATPAAPAAPAAPALGAPAQTTAPAPAEPESLDVLYEKARAEGGTLSLYATINPGTASKVFGAFEARFPGLKVEWVDGITERLVTRIVSEVRGGRMIADVLQGNIDAGAQLQQRNLVVDYNVPEAAAYPDTLKGPYWLASDLKFYVIGWNTNLVAEGNEPKGFEDLADPRWRGRLMGDPVDVDLLIALAKHKYQSDEQATDLLRRIAANNPEFHKGHSELIEFLVAGQAAVCMTCFSHHFPPRIKRGAPINVQLNEGIGSISANVILKGAPHPNTALLWTRWVATEEGQQTYAEAGHTPAHPDVPSLEKTRPERIYAMRPEDYSEYPRYERVWKEVFQVR